jgi:hypothetical protein
MKQETQLDLNDDVENLYGQASDEALEDAGCSGPLLGRSFTIAMCTGGLECPF